MIAGGNSVAGWIVPDIEKLGLARPARVIPYGRFGREAVWFLLLIGFEDGAGLLCDVSRLRRARPTFASRGVTSFGVAEGQHRFKICALTISGN
jgi:hypothetical protein